MKPLSVEMACLLGIQNEIQAVCSHLSIKQAGLQILKNIKLQSTLFEAKIGLNYHSL